MRNLSLFLAAAVLVSPVWAQRVAPGRRATTPARAPDRCNPVAGTVDYRDQRPAPRKLAEMPPATQIYTVYTLVDGCPRPVMVRGGIGADRRQQQQPALRTPPRLTPAK